MLTPIIVGTGLVSPLGVGVVEHAFYFRAAVAAPPPAAFETEDGERIDAVHCGFLGAASPMVERLWRLAEIAIHEALAPWEAARGPGHLALAFVAPSRPAIDASAVAEVHALAARRARAALTGTWVGAAGAFAALAEVRTWLAEGRAPAVLLLAVDSHISAAALSDFFEREDSVFCARTPPPAEGAAALLFTTPESARALGLRGPRLVASGARMGQGHDDDEVILDGRALTSLVESMPAPPFALVTGQGLVDDLRTRDWCLAYARTGARFVQPATLVTLEEETGRLGAAAGAAALAFGVGVLQHGILEGLACDATCLAWAISGDGTRGTALLRGGEKLAPQAAHRAPRVVALDGAQHERLAPMQADGAAESDDVADERRGPSREAVAGLPDVGIASANDNLPTAPELPWLGATSGRKVRMRKGQGAPVTLAASHEEIAAACLDGIALAACHRMTLRRDRRSREEERILAFTDALLVTPRFVPLLGRWWQEAATLPDPWKVWAPVFVLGCLDGDVAPSGLAHVLRALAEEDAEAAVIAGEALAATPHPDRLGWAAELARDAHPSARAAALTARATLGGLPLDALIDVLAKERSRTVRWAAVRAASRAPPDRRLDGMLLAEVRSATDAAFLWEVLRALSLRGHATAYQAMRHDPGLVARLGGRALSVLALFGDANDAPLAQQVARRSGLTSSVVQGLGRYGHPGALPLLLRALSDEDSADDASEALVWIFGVPFDENDLESADAWRTWIRATTFREDTRLRFGKPYTPMCVAEAAEEGVRSQADVAWLVEEAQVRCGLAGAPDLTAWSTVADAALSPVVAALGREAAPFARNPWHTARSGAERRRETP